MKSVIRSSILLGSSTKVGNVTRDRSMPTLWKWVGILSTGSIGTHTEVEI